MKACILFTSDNEVAKDWIGKFDSREPLDIYGQKYLIDEISTDYEPGFSGVTIKMYPVLQIKIADWPKKEYKMNIDWSKAPEDAAHVNRRGIFFKFDENLNARFYSGFRWCDNGWKRGDYDTIGELIERPKKKDAWDGNGKPPIGIECEVRINDAWSICKTLAYHQVSDTAVAVHFLDGSNSLFWCGTFRPIKTAEQLAEEEKKKAIDDMQRIYEESMLDYSSRLGHASRPAIKALYEAGYRKQ